MSVIKPIRFLPLLLVLTGLLHASVVEKLLDDRNLMPTENISKNRSERAIADYIEKMRLSIDLRDLYKAENSFSLRTYFTPPSVVETRRHLLTIQRRYLSLTSEMDRARLLRERYLLLNDAVAEKRKLLLLKKRLQLYRSEARYLKSDPLNSAHLYRLQELRSRYVKLGLAWRDTTIRYRDLLFEMALILHGSHATQQQLDSEITTLAQKASGNCERMAHLVTESTLLYDPRQDSALQRQKEAIREAKLKIKLLDEKTDLLLEHFDLKYNDRDQSDKSVALALAFSIPIAGDHLAKERAQSQLLREKEKERLLQSDRTQTLHTLRNRIIQNIALLHRMRNSPHLQTQPINPLDTAQMGNIFRQQRTTLEQKIQKAQLCTAIRRDFIILLSITGALPGQHYVRLLFQ